MAVPDPTVKRLQRDYTNLLESPLHYITAHPLEDNILEWHYAIRGPEDTPFFGGVYHGSLKFPQQFPMKPPAIYMHTPNGRFEVNVRLCLTISDFHPETWSPLWTVSAVLTGLLSFMVEKSGASFIGALNHSDDQRKQLAKDSWSFNLKNQTFCNYFPELAIEARAMARK